MRRYVFTLTSVVLTYACLASSTAQPTGVGDTVRLRIGESFVVTEEDVTIHFDAVIEDSRCPTGVTCVWEGDGVVKLTASKNGQNVSLELHTHPNFAGEGSAHGCRIRLVGLTPHPAADQPVDSRDYVATIVVSKS